MQKKKLRWILLIILPIAVIILGITALKDRHYYFVSLCIIGITCLFFVKQYGKRKIQTSEVVLVCSLSAIAISGRAAFYWIPQFKPVTAVVIISAVSLGPEAGAMVGALTGFLSNFFFGQGPWTPYQMYSWALIGIISGFLFYKRRLHFWILILYGFLITFLIYGGIMNFASVLMFTNQLSVKAIIAYYISGIPMDFIHASSTAIFLYFIINPFYETISRIKIKYGLLEMDE